MIADNNFKISVITVCFNASKLLPKTIQSVVDQTYANIEYIIIDGASNDNTKEIVYNHAPDVSLFLSEPDNGLYYAMNKAILKAKGEFIIFLNAGDYFVSKDVLDFLISKIKNKPAEIFYGKIIWNSCIDKNIISSEHNYLKKNWHLLKDNFPHPATIYRRCVFDKIGLFDTRYSIMADYELNLRALIKFKLTFEYLSFITTVFFTDGISNSHYTTILRENENKKIREQYFDLTFLNLFYNYNWLLGFSFLEKIVTKKYKCNLNRFY